MKAALEVPDPKKRRVCDAHGSAPVPVAPVASVAAAAAIPEIVPPAVAAMAASPMSSDITPHDLMLMSVRQLKHFLTVRGVNCADCIEKCDLVDRAKVALGKLERAANRTPACNEVD